MYFTVVSYRVLRVPSPATARPEPTLTAPSVEPDAIGIPAEVRYPASLENALTAVGTVGIVGLLTKSLYEPEVATVARLDVLALPAIAVLTCAAV
jgi:hypothetical protein